MNGENLNRWQGIEHEFRVGYPYAKEIIHSLQEYNFFPDFPAFCSSKSWRYDGFLRNGSRIYICTGDHLEISTPECRNAFEVLKYDKAAEFYAQLGAELASQNLKNSFRGQAVQCWKANVEIDSRYSRGTHESYTIARNKYKGKERLLIPYLVLRKLFTGAGGYIGNHYVISPRAMVSKRVLVEPHYYWPILSTRDEPLTTRDKFRIHITSGEGLRSEVTRLLNNGITSYIISAIESEKLKKVPMLYDPLQTFKNLSRNTVGDWIVKLYNEKKIGAIDYLNTYYLPVIEELFEERETDYWDLYILKTYKKVMKKLDEGLIESPYVRRRIEWVMKYWAIENEIDDFEYDGVEVDKKIAASFDFTNVCDYDLYEKIADKIRVERLLSERDIGEAMLYPPKNSRAELRTRLSEDFPNSIIGWNKITIKMEPEIRIKKIKREKYQELRKLAKEGAGVVEVDIKDLEDGKLFGRLLVKLLSDMHDSEFLFKVINGKTITEKFEELDGWSQYQINKKIEEIKKKIAGANVIEVILAYD
ncbi:MAG: proteasome accessory factor PafA2 family protein [Methanosarcinales archaeon]